MVFYAITITLSLLFSSLVPRRGDGRTAKRCDDVHTAAGAIVESVAKKCVSCAGVVVDNVNDG